MTIRAAFVMALTFGLLIGLDMQDRRLDLPVGFPPPGYGRTPI